MYLSNYRPWLIATKRFWKQLQSEVRYRDNFGTIRELVVAAADFSERCNLRPKLTLSTFGTIQ